MRKVLVVDDDEGLLFIIGEYLEAFGLECELANGPTQARVRLKDSNYDAIVSDLEMPGESGLDLFRYVSPRFPSTPFIIMTGCTDSRVKREAMKIGVSNYIEKPFRMADLIQLLSNPDLTGMGTGVSSLAASMEHLQGNEAAPSPTVN
ncbi:MAG: response regulator [Syntrophobacter sp.]